MKRIALGISYNGARYHGWQFQGHQLATIQASLQRALSEVADHPVLVTCAGRTDTGVHATGQVVHFDTHAGRQLKAWVMGSNALLPDDISVTWAQEMPATFDARHSAISRRYLYLINNTRVRSALMPEMLTREHRPLDAERMHKAAQALLGENDFSSFRASNCQSRTPMRNIEHICVHRSGEMVLVDVAANAFLHHMVRNIVGVLQDVGAGERTKEWPAELLALKDRTKGGVTAPPNGLFLIHVVYPSALTINANPALPHFFSDLLNGSDVE